MADIDQVLDHLEAAWCAWANVPAGTALHPDLHHPMWQVGQVIETHRPGLVDRFTATLDDPPGHPRHRLTARTAHCPADPDGQHHVGCGCEAS